MQTALRDRASRIGALVNEPPPPPAVNGPLRLYRELAAWWPLVDDPEDYAEQARLYGGLLSETCDAPIESLLELGSGGGNNALHLNSPW